MASSSNPPSLEMLQKLQLFRTTLVSFMDWRNFTEVVVGCYVRVLLEVRGEDRRRDGADLYYIARVKDTKKGPSYSGFTANNATTELHIVIEMPPYLNNSSNANVVQLNSISNSPFRQSEYQHWVQTNVEFTISFPSMAQLQFRLGMLEEQKQQALKPDLERPRKDEDPRAAAQRIKALDEKRKGIVADVLATHVRVPRVDDLKHKGLDQLQELESEMLDLISSVRVAINERSKCMVCRNRVCTEICYPCKHQVLCKACASEIHGRCPAPGCTVPVTEIIEPYLTV